LFFNLKLNQIKNHHPYITCCIVLKKYRVFYMIVNFKARGISWDMRKLTRTPKLIIKKHTWFDVENNRHYLSSLIFFLYVRMKPKFDEIRTWLMASSVELAQAALQTEEKRNLKEKFKLIIWPLKLCYWLLLTELIPFFDPNWVLKKSTWKPSQKKIFFLIIIFKTKLFWF